MNKLDLINMKFGSLTVLQMTSIIKHHSYCLCRCECGKEVTISASLINTGKRTHCGCKSKHNNQFINNSPNTYEFTQDYVILNTIDKNNNTHICCFDIDDYSKIKNYTWYKDNYGYFVSRPYIDGKLKSIKLHRLIMCDSINYYLYNETFKKYVIDHIDGNTFNNRKCNLRMITQHENSMNCKLSKNNTSGFNGVSFVKKTNKWIAQIKYQYKNNRIGSFETFEEAKQARIKAEIKLYGENSSLFRNKYILEDYNNEENNFD